MTQLIALHDELIDALKAGAQPILPDDAMGEAGRKIMLREFIAMLKHEAGSRTGDDIEDVHDMRVATRRMRSALRLLTDYYKSKATKVFNRKLSRVARALGAVRDLDVMIVAFEKYATKLETDEPNATSTAAIERILTAMDGERQLARLELVHALDRGEYRRFVADFGTFLQTAGAGVKAMPDDTTPVQVRHVLPTLIYSHVGAVRAFDTALAKAISENDQNTLHLLRIEFKRLRYAISMFEQVLGASVETFIDELKKIQDHLGDLQDIYTAAIRLNEFKAEIDDPDASALIDRYIADGTADAEQKRAAFAEVWKRFNARVVQRMLATAVAAL
ncbi:MAG: CHAD domain-containing protein [Chloroflexota bacterium]|nr:CHAD domain-containing protein [Chloroflexota bacterium]